MIRWVSFRLGKEICGVGVIKVQEVLRCNDSAPVPGAPSCVLGIINLRGKVVTVIDTKQRFGLPAVEISGQAQLIIIEADNDVSGILVDTVAEVVHLGHIKTESAPNAEGDDSSRFTHDVCRKNKELLILAKFDKLLNEQEWLETRKSL